MADEIDGSEAPARPPVGPRGGGPQFKGGVPWEGGSPEGLSPTAPAWSIHSATPPAAYVPTGSDGGLSGPPFTYGYTGAAAAAIMAPREHPEANSVLMMGIFGFVLCGFFSPFAWVKGNRVLRHIDSAPALYSNRGAAATGRILGIVGTVLMFVSVPLMMSWIVGPLVFL